MGFQRRLIHSISVTLSLKRKQEREGRRKMNREEGMADLREMTFGSHVLRYGFSGTHEDRKSSAIKRKVLIGHIQSKPLPTIIICTT